MSEPSADLSLAAEFLDLLARRPGSPFSFQTFDDDKQRSAGRLARVLHGTLEECSEDLVRLNGAGAGIFVTVNETDLRGRKAANVVGLRALFIDKDDDPPGSFPIEPNLVTGREEVLDRWHAYWLLQPGEPLGLFREAQRALIAYYRADPTPHDLPRVLRVPGFLHRKAAPQMVRILRLGPADRYTIEEILRAHGDRPPKPGCRAHGRTRKPTTAPSLGAADKDQCARRFLGEALRSAVAPLGGRPGNRNETALWLSCQLRDLGLREADARSFVEEMVGRAPAGDHPFTASEALRTLASAYSRSPRKPPAKPARAEAATALPCEAVAAETDIGPDESTALRFEAAGITAVIEGARKPGAKWMADLRIGLAGSTASLGVLPVTTSAAGFEKAQKALLGLLADHDRAPDEEQLRELRRLLRRVLDPEALAHATAVLAARAAAAEPTGPTMVGAAEQWLEGELAPAFFGTRGAVWSERKRRSVTAAEVAGFTCCDLIEALSKAVDFAAPTERDPLKPYRAAPTVLRAAMTNIARRLTDEVRAEQLGPASAAAQARRNQIIEIWTHPENWARTTDAGGRSVTQRSSLAGCVRQVVEAQQPPRSSSTRSGGGWSRPVSGIDAYYLVPGQEGQDEAGRPRVYLGMRYTLLRQIPRLRVEGPRNQRDFEHLLRRYGLTAPEDEVGRRTGRHGERIAVLSLELSEHLVWGADRVGTSGGAPATGPDATPEEPENPQSSEVRGGE